MSNSTIGKNICFFKPFGMASLQANVAIHENINRYINENLILRDISQINYRNIIRTASAFSVFMQEYGNILSDLFTREFFNVTLRVMNDLYDEINEDLSTVQQERQELNMGELHFFQEDELSFINENNQPLESGDDYDLSDNDEDIQSLLPNLSNMR